MLSPQQMANIFPRSYSPFCPVFSKALPSFSKSVLVLPSLLSPCLKPFQPQILRLKYSVTFKAHFSPSLQETLPYNVFRTAFYSQDLYHTNHACQVKLILTSEGYSYLQRFCCSGNKHSQSNLGTQNKNETYGTWEMAQLVKCLLHKH